MAMTVAETKVTEKPAVSNPTQAFFVASLIGAIGVLASLGFVFGGLPYFWEHAGILSNNPFLSSTLLLVVGTLALAGLVFLANRVFQSQSLPGIRAGVFVAALALFLAAWITISLGQSMAERNAENASFGLGVMGLVFAALVGGLAYLYTRPFWPGAMEEFESQGWFQYGSYKGNQGVRVRRATVVAALTLGICGIITLLNSRSFGSERQGNTDWKWVVPFMSDEENLTVIPLIYNSPVIMPLVLGGLLVWFSYRLVNLPVFADFLIATEAEMNKVSWTTRKRLVQDTIVVLVTVFLMTAFLFTVDLLWIKILSNPYVGVLRVDLKEAQQKQQEKATW